MESLFLPVLIFLLVLIAITFELANKTAVVMLAVSILVALNVIEEDRMIEKINFETIMLLLGMMTLVVIIKKTGFFIFISTMISEFTKGAPLKILLLFSLITVTLSAFLDNVTTLLIIIPIIIQLTRGMGMDPKIYIISQAIISNIGGTATLVGDPPNIIIGSKVGLTFNQFILNLTIPVVITFAAAMFYIWITNRKNFRPINTNLTKIFTFQLLLEEIRFEFLNTKLNKVLITKSLGCLGIVILLFVTQSVTHLTPSLIAISGAMVLFIISKVSVEEIFEAVEWSTLLFFAGLFILVGTLEEYGALEWIAHKVFLKVGNNPYVMVLMVLWLSGIASGFLDNIPFTMAMIPIVQQLSATAGIPHNILWWALSLGACLGGNFTIIGSSANIVSIGIAKQHKANISFLEFMKTGSVIALISLVISSLYLTTYLWLVM